MQSFSQECSCLWPCIFYIDKDKNGTYQASKIPSFHPQTQSDALALQHRSLLTDYDKLFSPLYNILHLCRLFFVILHLIASLIDFPNHLGWLQIPHYFPRFCFSGLALWVCGTSNDNNNHSSSIINNTFVGLEIMTGNHSGLEVHWLHFFFPDTE